MKTKGWRREPARHSLAARGVSTREKQNRSTPFKFARPSDGERVLIGYASVDSGQIMVVDPCYLHDWKAEDYVIGKEPKPDKGKYPFSYPGACAATQTDRLAGQAGLGVVVASGYGDGSYPVYAEYEDGRIKKLAVEFFGDDEEVEDEE